MRAMKRKTTNQPRPPVTLGGVLSRKEVSLVFSKASSLLLRLLDGCASCCLPSSRLF